MSGDEPPLHPAQPVAKCWSCNEPVLDDGVPKRAKQLDVPVVFHAACWHAHERSRAEEATHHDAWLRRYIESRCAPALRDAPVWPWARVDTPEFATRAHPRLRQVATRWRPERGNIAIIGPTGVGKTVTTRAIAQSLVDDAIAACMQSRRPEGPELDLAAGMLWTTALGLVAARRGHPLGQGESKLWVRAASARVLVLDELGQEQSDPRWLLELLDHGYTRGRILITTSGLTRPELEQRYGSGTVRRMVEPLGAFVDVHPTGGE